MSENLSLLAPCVLMGGHPIRPPAGLLQPLPVPGHPWSLIAVNFFMGLSPSEGNTVILTVVDRFSKIVHFVLLSKLPSAMETTNHLVAHVVWLHCWPKGIVSDRGPLISVPHLVGLLYGHRGLGQPVLQCSSTN